MDLLNTLRRRMAGGKPSMALELFRPNLGRTPQPVRGFLEPVIAVVSVATLVSLAATGLSALAVLMAVSLLIYAILNYVFGIRLELPA